jgi:hypothetical protein
MKYVKLKSTGRLIVTQFGGSEDSQEDLIVFATETGHPLEELDYGYESDSIVTEWADKQEEADKLASITYVDLRLEDYPSIEECLHAILDDDLEALQVKRQEVKNRYPKP